MAVIDKVKLNGSVIRERIMRAGMSRHDLAKESKIAPATLRRAILGVPVSPRTARRIASSLGVNSKALIVETNATGDWLDRKETASGGPLKTAV